MTINFTDAEHALLTAILASDTISVPVMIGQLPAVGATLLSIRQKLAAPEPKTTPRSKRIVTAEG